MLLPWRAECSVKYERRVGRAPPQPACCDSWLGFDFCHWLCPGLSLTTSRKRGSACLRMEAGWPQQAWLFPFPWSLQSHCLSQCDRQALWSAGVQVFSVCVPRGPSQCLLKSHLNYSPFPLPRTGGFSRSQWDSCFTRAP